MIEAAYDRIGLGYGAVRRPEPRIAARIEAALGDAKSVVRADLDSGRWDERHGHLRRLPELDVGLRLISAELR